jgi:myo-inositol-1(or 4)-monophosphatase
VFAEELDNAKVASRVLRCLEGNPVFPRIRTSTEEFRHNWERSIAILVDAIDGTVNFEANLPFFCSAVSIFIGGQLCIGAVYDPFHNQVFYGSLRHFPDGAFGRVANVWSIQSGNLEVLGSRERHSGTPTLLGMHITRSDDEERRRFLEFLPFLLAEKELNGGTYMLNSGEMSLAHVASRNLSAFLNNYTKIWDVAAGEVLVRAIGGKVTDFRGNAIDYGAKKEISVVASENPGIHRRIRNLIDRHYRFGAANNTC